MRNDDDFSLIGELLHALTSSRSIQSDKLITSTSYDPFLSSNRGSFLLRDYSGKNRNCNANRRPVILGLTLAFYITNQVTNDGLT